MTDQHQPPAAPNQTSLTGAGPIIRRPVAGIAATLEDVVAILAAQQDQIDDLTAVVEDLVRRTAGSEAGGGSQGARARADQSRR